MSVKTSNNVKFEQFVKKRIKTTKYMAPKVTYGATKFRNEIDHFIVGPPVCLNSGFE